MAILYGWQSPQLVAVEVKPIAGSYDVSSLQLGIWLAAGIEMTTV